MRKVWTTMAAGWPAAGLLATGLLATGLAAADLPAAGRAAPVGLSTVGNVWTNQVALPSGSRVAAGDVIETDETGLAILASSELGRVEVRASTKAMLEARRVALGRGSVASGRLPVRFGDVEASPAAGDSPAWVVVSDHGGRAMVTAHEGDVVLRRAGFDDVVVPAGHYALAAAPQQAPGVEEDDDDDDAAAADAPSRRTTPSSSGRARGAGSSGGGFTIGPLGPAASVALVGGATAAGLAGFALAAQDDTPVSPE